MTATTGGDPAGIFRTWTAPSVRRDATHPGRPDHTPQCRQPTAGAPAISLDGGTSDPSRGGRSDRSGGGRSAHRMRSGRPCTAAARSRKLETTLTPTTGSERGGHGARHRTRPGRREALVAAIHRAGPRRRHATCWSEPGRGRHRLTPGSGSSHHRGPARTSGQGCGVTRRRRLRPAEGSGRSQPGTARRPPTRWRACRWGPTAAPCPDLPRPPAPPEPAATARTLSLGRRTASPCDRRYRTIAPEPGGAEHQGIKGSFRILTRRSVGKGCRDRFGRGCHRSRCRPRSALSPPRARSQGR